MTYVGLLRAVNVAGHQPVSMADLRAFFAAIGFDDPKTLLQSGNVVFKSRIRAAGEIERVLEARAVRHLKQPIEFFVRTAAEWQEIVARNPFPKEAKADPGRLIVMCFKDDVDANAVKALQAAIVGREQVRGGGRQAYFVYPDGMGRSRVTNALIERKLGTRGTARNWNTVLKLEALAK
jgi:uncharacterized protein (DUF1697 family)